MVKKYVDLVKMVNSSNYHTFISVQQIVTSTMLVLLHMDLFDPTPSESIGRKRYVMVCIYDYSRYTWVDF
jgi:hypothetical protein